MGIPIPSRNNRQFVTTIPETETASRAPRIGINDQLAVRNMLRKGERVYSWNHDVMMTVHHKRRLANELELRKALAALAADAIQ